MTQRNPGASAGGESSMDTSLPTPRATVRLPTSPVPDIVPLQDNTCANCKSELKVFEASVVGTISIASPSFTLRRAVVEGETGYLAPTQSRDAVLDQAIARLNDYAGMAEAAAEAADRQYRAAAYGETIAGILFR